MELLLSFFAPYLPVILVSALTVLLIPIGIFSFVFDVRELGSTLRVWRKEKLEFQQSVKYLKQVDYFFAHIVHLGGNFSRIHSLTVLGDKEGGYNFTPPEKFVVIEFSKEGKLISVLPSNAVSAQGFTVDSASSSTNSISYSKKDGSFSYLITDTLKNEFSVRFARKSSSKIVS